MKWPRIYTCGWVSSDEDGPDIDGWSLHLEWLGLVLEMNFGKRGA